jgi:hypothetical protein
LKIRSISSAMSIDENAIHLFTVPLIAITTSKQYNYNPTLLEYVCYTFSPLVPLHRTRVASVPPTGPRRTSAAVPPSHDLHPDERHIQFPSHPAFVVVVFYSHDSAQSLVLD